MTTTLLSAPYSVSDSGPVPPAFTHGRSVKRRGPVPLPPFPTHAVPGTREKVAILAQRARMKVALWHPDDIVLDRRFALSEAV